MEKARTLFTLCALISLLVNHAFSLKPCHFPAIFNFGASNSDTGGYSAAFYPRKSPNGNTFFGMPAGRYCDGRLIIDFTAESLGLPYLSAYLNSLASNFSHGANFASSASTIRLPKTIIPNGLSSPFFLSLQYSQFAQFKARSQIIRRQGGVYASLMPRKEHFRKALYTFDTGQNDLALSTALFFNKTQEEVSDMVYQFIYHIKNIYSLGGRSFWVYGTRPFGCFPFVLTGFPEGRKDSSGCVKLYNEFVESFNAELKKGLAYLRNQFPLATFVYVDLYSAMYPLYANPAKYGFEQPLVTCCGYGGKYNYNASALCGETINVNGTSITVGSCKDPSVRVSWDGIHLTEAANKFIFDRIATGAFSDPPIPLKMACHPTRLLQS